MCRTDGTWRQHLGDVQQQAASYSFQGFCTTQRVAKAISEAELEGCHPACRTWLHAAGCVYHL